MFKLFCVTGYKINKNDPIINGRQTRQMILEESKDMLTADVERLMTAINRLQGIVNNVYRIQAVEDSAAEYHNSLAALNRDNIQAQLTVDRRFRSYVIECDMFLDYWEAYIAHHKRIDNSTEEELIQEYKMVFKRLTNEEYDNHVEYQLIDLIRNQTAHVQSPVNRIHIGMDGNEAFSFRDELLIKCKSGEKKKSILKRQQTEIALSPIVKVTLQSLQAIHAGLMMFQLDDLVAEECKYVDNFISYAISKCHLYEPWVIMEADDRAYHINDIKAYGYILNLLNCQRKDGLLWGKSLKEN